MKKYKEKNHGKLEDVPDAFVATYSVELYMEEHPVILENKLLESIKKYCGNVEIMSKNDTSITFGFSDYVMEYKNATVPASIMISLSHECSES